MEKPADDQFEQVREDIFATPPTEAWYRTLIRVVGELELELAARRRDGEARAWADDTRSRIERNGGGRDDGAFIERKLQELRS